MKLPTGAVVLYRSKRAILVRRKRTSAGTAADASAVLGWPFHADWAMRWAPRSLTIGRRTIHARAVHPKSGDCLGNGGPGRREGDGDGDRDENDGQEQDREREAAETSGE
jgi:hypothetical protein